MMKAEDIRSNSLPYSDPWPGPSWFRPLQVLCTLFGLITFAVEVGILVLILYKSTLNQSVSQVPLTLSFCVIGIFLTLASHLSWLIWSPLLLSRLFHLSQPPVAIGVPNQSGPTVPTQSTMPGNPISRTAYNTAQYPPLQPNHSTPLQEDPRAASLLSTSLIQPRSAGGFVPRYGQSGSLNISAAMLDTVHMRSFAVPREGTNIEISADKLAINNNHTRYALADGVGTSFLPGRWAEIITRRFVERIEEFQDRGDFEEWLRTCSQEWHTWVQEHWLPTAIENSGQTNWNRELERGGSSTLVGCSISWNDLLKEGNSQIQVTTVGDATFFLVSPDPNNPMSWMSDSFYLKKAEDFTQESSALGSAVGRITRDWKRVHMANFQATHSDIIVLATDALAQWIMKAQEANYDPWKELFAIHDLEHFRRFVQRYRDNGLMEVDDTTVIIIPLSGGPRNGLESN